MNICLIGDGLASLTLAKNLINKNIKVDICYENRKKPHFNSRTIGISKDNLDFFNKEIVKINQKKICKIKKIEIYSEKFENEKVLNFVGKKELFSIVKNKEIFKILNSNLNKSKFFKKILVKDKVIYEKILKDKKYDLIINLDSKNNISKNFFSNKIMKDYGSFAYTSIIKHKKIENNKAIQIFTKIGPIAFLPISNSETSIVFSIVNQQKNITEKDFIYLIKNFNKKYEIKDFSKVEKFKLETSISRNYYKHNLLAFGDCLHKIHPLAGQGFNMILRDIKVLSSIIQNRIDLGFPIDFSICKEFENKTKHYNFLFSMGNDFIYEFFKFDNNYKNNYLNYLLKFFSKNEIFNKFAHRYANRGLFIE